MKAADDCALSIAAPAIEHYSPNTTLSELTANAADIVSGTITAVRQGFYRGFPAMLARIQVIATHVESRSAAIRAMSSSCTRMPL